MCLYNLIDVLHFRKDEYINITYIRSHLKSLLSNTMENENNINANRERNQVYKWIKSSFSKIYIKYGHNRAIVNTEQPQFQQSDILAAIGGSLGLWIGWSALTLVEFASLIVKFFKCPLTCDIKKDKVHFTGQ